MYNKFPILVYHQIVPDEISINSFNLGHQPYLSKYSEFYSHLKYLDEKNFSTLTIKEIYPFKKKQPLKNVMITFDDGQISDYTIAFPALSALKMKATFYVITNLIGKKGWINWRQLREMQKYGMEIGSHSCSHRCFLGLKRDEIQSELEKSRQILEDRLGCPIHSFSIPFGFWNHNIIQMAFEAEYKTICTSVEKLSRFNASIPVYGRIGIRRGISIQRFKGVVEMEYSTIGRLILKDNIKTALKSCLGRNLWLKFRYLMLKNVMDKNS